MNRRILFLDDEQDFLDIYRFILTTGEPAQKVVGGVPQVTLPDAFELTTCSSGEQALKTIEDAVSSGRPFSGGFFDVRLGRGIDGIETIRRAKDLDPNLLCVIVTGQVDRSVEEITRIFGREFSDRWDFLSKPFTEGEILQKANNLVSNWDRRRREREYLQQIQEQQNQLVHAERLAAVGTLARGIGHEFGNVLHHIMGRAELALKDGTLDEMQIALKQILSSSERAGVIVRNLQALVRMETRREPVRLKDSVAECLSLVDYEMKKSRVTLKMRLDELPPLKVNRVEINQVCLNLLINAIQAMEGKGGELEVTLYGEEISPGEKWALLRVKDQGCGIPPENLARVFEPLFTTRPSQGSGIGLSVVRRVVENHGGRISVESEVGRGATFSLRLPL